jgi:ABC-type sugar transport system ATPase subunit
MAAMNPAPPPENGRREPRPLLVFREVCKRFPGVVALRDVSFEVAAGSCHALMGENGAGKSTLGKILAGLYRPDSGGIEIEGHPQRFRSPGAAQRAGIGLVHQELSYCPNLTVAENLCLSALPRRGPFLDRAAMMERTKRSLEAVGAQCDPDEELGRLTNGQIQLVQIAAALATGARVLVLDEPTSSLSRAEARNLEGLIGQLRRQGATILYVSHRMEEIFRLCDTATVLRDGRHVATLPVAQTSEDELVRLMIGRSLEAYFPAHVERAVGGERLRVESVSSRGRFCDVSFSVRAGEVLGVAGLAGSGRSEVAQGIFGMDPAMTGRVWVDGTAVAIRNPRQAFALGIGLVTEDRQRLGIVSEMSCGENLTLSALDCPEGRGLWARAVRCPWCPKRQNCLRLWDWLRLAQERSWVQEFFGRLRVRAASPEAPMTTLSGGNQQKVVLAKCLARRCRVLMLDEPTRGVDVGAKAEIHRLIDGLASSGHAVLMISSELPEVLHLSTRVLVMREGRVAGVVSRADATEETLMQLMAGRAAKAGPSEAAHHVN